MSIAPRIPAWTMCLGVCLLAGCGTLRSACTTCAGSSCTTAAVTPQMMDIPSTYENYTPPPQPRQIPLPPAGDDPLSAPPPPPATKYDPNNKMIDYFETATENRSPADTR